MKHLRKPYIWIPALLVLLAAVIFGGWWLLPSRVLDVAVLDKTVPAGSNDADLPLLYRKHYGLFWLLNTRKYVQTEDKGAYQYTSDYYGTRLKDDMKPVARELSTLGRVPDILYLSDTYGQGDDSAPGGLSYDDIAAAALAHGSGATLIGESDILGGNTEDSVKAELESLFGFSYTGWTGRYIRNMADLSDVPDWAQSLHESQFGRPWDYEGPGLLLVSAKSQLVVLEEKDFSGDFLRMSISPDYQKEFGKLSANFYNWFEIVEPAYGTEVLASYSLSLSDSGKEKYAAVSAKTEFPAMLRVGGSAPAYYFAGDFNDYVAPSRFSKYLFSEQLYRLFSYDRPGDITNFYWKVFTPVMDTILKQAEKNRDHVQQTAAASASPLRIENGRFEVKSRDGWQPFAIKGLNIQAATPGSDVYTRDSGLYAQYLAGIGRMGGTCVGVYDLMPPEFYRALFAYNQTAEQPLYLMQTIPLPAAVDAGQATAAGPLDEAKAHIRAVLDALHGKGKAEASGSQPGGTYLADVSAYLMACIVQIDTDAQTVQKLAQTGGGFTYSGAYISAADSPAEALLAALCDEAFAYHTQTYGYAVPIGAAGNAALISGTGWLADAGGPVFDAGRLTASDETGGQFFTAYELQPSDPVLLNHQTDLFGGYTDDAGGFAYGGYLKAVKAAQNRHPVLISRLSLSTNTNAFEKETAINGLTEEEQGSGLVRMLKAVDAEGYLGGFIGDYNDSWSALSAGQAPFTLPAKDNALWHNMLDSEQNTGLVSVEPKSDGKIGMSLKDTGRMKEMQVSADAAYLNLTLVLDKEIDYDREQLIIGLDTYQRNNGEYRYDPAYFATSLSGMEYVVKFESKNTAALYVIPSYNRNKDGYVSKETYTGQFDYVCQLVYGPFDSAANHFYQTGATVRVRIPWSLLNVTDPARLLVVQDTRSPGQIAADVFGLQTTATDGVLFSLLIADKETKDTAYIFPATKESGGYKTFKWDAWESVNAVLRDKAGVKILSRYFQSGAS